MFAVAWLLLCSMHMLQAKSPNIVFVLTDDQDVTLGGMDQMPKTTRLLVNNGLTFTNAFVSSPICCVSRASILSGRYIHNHGTSNNSIAGNCSSPFWQTQIEPTCFAPSVKTQESYTTFYAGKYLNTYGSGKAGGTAHIPSGWDRWYGLVGNSKYYNYNISDNGKNVGFGSTYSTDYYTDLIKNQALEFIAQYAANHSVLMVLAPPAAHAIFTPAPQYNITNETAPRIPNFNFTQNKAEKHSLLTKLSPMSGEAVFYTDYIYSQRHGTLKSVDDMVESVWNMAECTAYEVERNEYIQWRRRTNPAFTLRNTMVTNLCYPSDDDDIENVKQYAEFISRIKKI